MSEPSGEQPQAPREDEATDGSVDEALAESGQQDEARFSRGEALEGPAATRIAMARRATVVVLLGGANSGKTTLLAALYERFGRGPLAGHVFLGSRTLHGFERRCHRSSFGPGPGSGAGGHTAADAPPWLHLRTARQETPEEIYELLLGDFSGEHRIKPLADGSRSASEFPALRRADHLCLTINGGAMASPGGRSAEQREQVELLRALLADPEGIAGASALSFVVTKWDLVHRAGEEARGGVEELFAQLRGMLPTVHTARRVGYLQTAARSTVPELPIGHGVGDLLSRFTDRPALHIAHPAPLAAPTNLFESFEAAL